MEELKRVKRIQEGIKRIKPEEIIVQDKIVTHHVETRLMYFTLLISGVLGPYTLRTGELLVTCDGGTFLYPYILCCLFIAMPIVHLELFMGQYTKKSMLALWKCAPISHGVFTFVGIMAICRSLIACNMGATLMFVFAQSFRTVPPWMSCRGTQNDKVICFDMNAHVLSPLCRSKASDVYITCPDGAVYQFPTSRYLMKTLFSTDDIVDYPQMKMLSLVFLYWLIIMVVQFRGIYRYTKVIFFILLSVAVCLVIVFLLVIVKSGVGGGLTYMFVININRVMDSEIWKKAIHHALRSLAVGLPIFLAYSSRLSFKTKLTADTVTLITLHQGITIFLLFIFYAMIGNLSHTMTMDIRTLQLTRTDAMWTLIPYYFGLRNLGQLLSIIYFLSLTLLHILSEIVITSAILQTILDYYDLNHKKKYIIIGYGVLCFVLSAPLASRYGHNTLMNLIDKIFLTVGISIVLLLETVTLLVLYGTRRVCEDVEFMYEYVPSMMWKISWYNLPIISVIFFSLQVSALFGIEKSVIVSHSILLILLIIHFAIIPVLAVRKVIHHYRKKNISAVFKPAFDWGPPNRSLRKKRKRFHPRVQIRSLAHSAQSKGDTPSLTSLASSWASSEVLFPPKHHQSSPVLQEVATRSDPVDDAKSEK